MQTVRALFRWVINSSLVRSLRFRLIGIVLLASLPTIALLFITASQQRTDALEAGQEEVVRLARLAANDQGREMDRVHRELSLLSRLPEVRGEDPSACTSLFQALVSDPENAIYVDLRVINQDGMVVCRSSASTILGPNIREQPFVKAAFNGTEFTVGSFRVSQGRTIISFAAPVHNEDGSINRVIVATLDLSGQSTYLTQSSLPEGAVFSIVADDGTLLLQRPIQEGAVLGESVIGTPVVNASIGIGNAQSTPVAGTGSAIVDEDDVLSAFAPIVVTGTTSVDSRAYVIVELPEEEIVESANNAFQDNLGKLGVAVAVVILAAWVSADLFVARDAETRKSIVAELYHGYSSGAVEHLDSIVSPDFTDHSPSPGQSKGVDGLKQNIAAFRTAFPDGEIVPREMLADRDKVVARVSLTGTHVGEFQGLPPSGKRMIADGMETFQFRDGVIAESWSLFGPLVEMKKLESPADRHGEIPQQTKPNIFQRFINRFRRNGDNEEPEEEAA